MKIFPAIDILDEKVVRLRQGDYMKSQVFSLDPYDTALQFFESGAKNLHIVDLDGARNGEVINYKIIEKIARNIPLFIECGGGIRNEETVERYLEMGINRVILGTAALKDQDFTRRMLEVHQDRIAIGVDAKNQKVATHGWYLVSEIDSIDFCKQMRDMKASYIIYTDIARDGTGEGGNIEVYNRLGEIQGLNITASGGISSIEEIQRYKEMDIYAVILGKAIYTGMIDIKEAIKYEG